MNIPLTRFIDLRDGKDVPRTEEELAELMAFRVRTGWAKIEQSLAQRRKPAPMELRAMEREVVDDLIKIYEDYQLESFVGQPISVTELGGIIRRVQSGETTIEQEAAANLASVTDVADRLEGTLCGVGGCQGIADCLRHGNDAPLKILVSEVERGIATLRQPT
jgi:hypothetical protein